MSSSDEGSVELNARSMIDATHASIKPNFDAPLNRLKRDVTLGLERLIFSLDALRSVTELPATVRTTHGSDVPEIEINARELSVVRDDTERWLLANAFRDVIEEIAVFFEGLRWLDAVIGLSDEPKLTLERFREVVEAPAKSFDKFPFHVKVERLLECGLLPTDSDAFLNGINAARNCLVHRRGLVGERDLGTANALCVAWSRPSAVARLPDGTEVAVRPGIELPGETELSIRYKATARVFRLGDRIQFSAEDFAGIWMSVSHFGEISTQLLRKKAEGHGFVFSPDGDAADDDSR